MAASSGSSIGGLGSLITAITDDILGVSDTENSAYNIRAAKEADSINYARFLENRNYETNLSNTAYQRARKDMEAAGINPALLSTASAASSPSFTSSYYDPANSTSNGLAGVIGSAVDIAEVNNKNKVKLYGKVGTSNNAYSFYLNSSNK